MWSQTTNRSVTLIETRVDYWKGSAVKIWHHCSWNRLPQSRRSSRDWRDNLPCTYNTVCIDLLTRPAPRLRFMRESCHVLVMGSWPIGALAERLRQTTQYVWGRRSFKIQQSSPNPLVWRSRDAGVIHVGGQPLEACPPSIVPRWLRLLLPHITSFKVSE